MVTKDSDEIGNDKADALRRVMRHWTTGVSIVTSSHNGAAHGMTVNSFTSISLDPPVVAVTLANVTRTLKMIEKSGIFGITILAENQVEIADRFAGKIGDDRDRMEGTDFFTLQSSSPLIVGGLAHLDCKVVFSYPLKNSTLLLGRVVASESGANYRPLVYLNRVYHRLEQT